MRPAKTTFADKVVVPPLLCVISGPSGVGKTSLCDRVVADVPDAVYSRSVTTRPRRPGESDGEEYVFVTPREFEAMQAEGRLLESACVHGHHYGTPRGFVMEQLEQQKIIVLNIDVQGGLQVMSSFPDGVFVFVLPPTREALEERLSGRGSDAPEAVELRLANVDREVAEARRYQYVVVNDDLDRCARRLGSILEAERCLRRRCYREFQ